MNYHPDIELLLKYANGQLEPALAIAIGLHHQHCHKCQSSISEIESISGESLEYSQDAEINDSSFDSLMKQVDSLGISAEKADEGPAHITQESSGLASSTYERLAVASSDVSLVKKLDTQDFQDTKWKRITSKISQSEILLGDDSFKVELLKFKPNAKIPKHTHKGNEFTVVVQGSFMDKYGQYQLGEFIHMDEHNEHQPIAGEEGCICLAITDKRLDFTGFLGPVINWMAR